MKLCQSYKDLEIYKLAHKLAIEIHHMSLKIPQFETYEEENQIRKSSKSICSNIAEGFGRRRYKNEFIQFLIYSLASCDETREHLCLLWGTGSLKDAESYKYFTQKYEELGKKLTRFIQAVENGHLTRRNSIENSVSSIKHLVSKRAFSLIEASIAVIIIASFTGGMLAIFWQGSGKNRGAKTQIVAYNLAQDKIEELSSSFPPTGTTTEGYGTIVNFPDFRRVTTVADFVYPGELRSITVTVFWNSDAESQSFDTLKADY